MLLRLSELKGMKCCAHEGEIGKVVDLLLQEGQWDIRYLVVQMQEPFPSRQILISPAAIRDLDRKAKKITTCLKADTVLKSPCYPENQPVSREYELKLVNHYNWPIYWLGRGRDPSNDKLSYTAGATFKLAVRSREEQDLAQLASAVDFCKFRIDCQHGLAGYLNDVVVHLATWRIANVIADSRSWLPAEPTMLDVNRIVEVDFLISRVFITRRAAEKETFAADRSNNIQDSNLAFENPQLEPPPFHTN